MKTNYNRQYQVAPSATFSAGWNPFSLEDSLFPRCLAMMRWFRTTSRPYSQTPTQLLQKLTLSWLESGQKGRVR